MAQKAIVLGTAFVVWQASVMPALAQSVDDAACNPVVQEALLQEASNGAQLQYGIVRNPTQGIKEPDSLWELNCLDDVMNAPNLNVLIDPDTIANWLIDQLKNKICQAYEEHYAANVETPFDPRVFTSKIPRLPGINVSGSTSDVIDGGGEVNIGIGESDYLGTGEINESLRDNLPEDVQNSIDGYQGGSPGGSTLLDSLGAGSAN